MTKIIEFKAKPCPHLRWVQIDKDGQVFRCEKCGEVRDFTKEIWIH